MAAPPMLGGTPGQQELTVQGKLAGGRTGSLWLGLEGPPLPVVRLARMLATFFLYQDHSSQHFLLQDIDRS